MNDHRARVLAKIAAAPRPTPEQVLRTRELIARSTRNNGDLRGNNRDRAARTYKLLVEFGDGTTCHCAYCPAILTAATLTQDKIIPGQCGGRYVFTNLLPACLHCNSSRRDLDAAEFIAAALGAILDTYVLAA